MRYIICLSGLPQDVVDEVKRRSSAQFTTSNDHPPIVRPLGPPYCYREGMSEYYLNAIATEIEKLTPTTEIGVALAYVDYGGPTADFVRSFYPFALTAPLDPFYPVTFEKHLRRKALVAYVDRIVEKVSALRARIAVMRDMLSGQRFSPLTLPLANFHSDTLAPTILNMFATLGTTPDARIAVTSARDTLLAHHPLQRISDQSHKPYFKDDRGLRFKSPGSDKHAIARRVGQGHSSLCLINGRVRLGGPLEANFHYDCAYAHRTVDAEYPNCHGAPTPAAKRDYVNIAPNDYIR
jgi:hypothetical protein